MRRAVCHVNKQKSFISRKICQNVLHLYKNKNPVATTTKQVQQNRFIHHSLTRHTVLYTSSSPTYLSLYFSKNRM